MDALHSGTPVVASAVEAIAEVSGDIINLPADADPALWADLAFGAAGRSAKLREFEIARRDPLLVLEQWEAVIEAAIERGENGSTDPQQ